ncbi:zinc finger protein 184-like [Mya arenaria]|uniref:zinc finger protein 184-like n=1 Tax=Mya arenaria TaxID=6604 RepID=UPI0022E8518A|nr:zinc finger protein 184-like [Mya arenaria]
MEKANRKMEALVESLLKDGYEALVMATHLEENTFLYKGTKLGQEFLKETPQLLRFPDFCRDSIPTKQVHKIQNIPLLNISTTSDIDNYFQRTKKGPLLKGTESGIKQNKEKQPSLLGPGVKYVKDQLKQQEKDFMVTKDEDFDEGSGTLNKTNYSEIKVETDLFTDGHSSDTDNETYFGELSGTVEPKQNAMNSTENALNERRLNVSTSANGKDEEQTNNIGKHYMRSCYVSLVKVPDDEVRVGWKRSGAKKSKLNQIHVWKGGDETSSFEEQFIAEKEDIIDKKKPSEGKRVGEKRLVTIDLPVEMSDGIVNNQGIKKEVVIELDIPKDYDDKSEDFESEVSQMSIKGKKRKITSIVNAEKEMKLPGTSLLNKTRDVNVKEKRTLTSSMKIPNMFIQTKKEKTKGISLLNIAGNKHNKEKMKKTKFSKVRSNGPHIIKKKIPFTDKMKARVLCSLDSSKRIESKLDETFGNHGQVKTFNKHYIEKCDKCLIDFLKENLNRKKMIADHKDKSLNGENVDGFSSKIVTFYEEWDEVQFESKPKFDVCPCCNMDLKLKEDSFCQRHFELHLEKLRQPVELCKHCHITLPSRWLALHCCICDIPRLTNTVNYWVRDIRDEVAAFTMKLCFGKDEKDTATCVECEEQFDNTFSLKYHFLQNHIFVFRHLGDCGMEFTNIADFAKHINPALVDDDSETRCCICQYSFTSSNNLEQHVLEKHPSISEGKCEKCGCWFPCKVHLLEHYCGKEVWLNKRKSKACTSIQCQIDGCCEWFPSSDLLTTHHWEAHGHKSELCTICGSSFIDKWRLKTHTEMCHGTPELYPCHICGRMYRGRSLLASHINTHEQELRYKCDKCSAAYRSRVSLFNHKTRVHPKGGVRRTFTCKVCSEPFYKNDSYKHHIVSKNHVTEDQPLPDIKTCEQCGKMFGSGFALSRHRRQQHSEKKLHCSVCEKPFACSSNLRQHMWTHTGQRPRCELCAIDFRSHRKLVEHMAEKHNVQMELRKNDAKLRKEKLKLQFSSNGSKP